MRVSYAPWGESIQEQVDAARAAESGGFTDVWVSELHRSAPVPLAAIAGATTTVGVGTAIALGFVRSPMTTALEAMDLDEISGGRLILGLGSGVQRLNEGWHNARFGKPAGHLRETIGVIRRFIAASHLGETIQIDGEYEPMLLRGYERPFPPVRTSIPIYIAAVGEVMTRLAGEIAQGWIGHELGSPAYTAQKVVPNIEAGIARGGRARGDVSVVASGVCAVDNDPKQAKRWAAGLVSFYATVKTYNEFFDFHGFLPEAQRIQERFRAGDEQGMIDACPDEMVDALALAGTPDDVRARLAEYRDVVDGIKLSPPTHGIPADVTRHCQKQILEILGA